MALSPRDFKLHFTEKPRQVTSGFTPDRENLISMIRQELTSVNPSSGAQGALEIVSAEGGIEIRGAGDISQTTIDGAVQRAVGAWMQKAQEHAAAPRRK